MPPSKNARKRAKSSGRKRQSFDSLGDVNFTKDDNTTCKSFEDNLDTRQNKIPKLAGSVGQQEACLRDHTRPEKLPGEEPLKSPPKQPQNPDPRGPPSDLYIFLTYILEIRPQDYQILTSSNIGRFSIDKIDDLDLIDNKYFENDEQLSRTAAGRIVNFKKDMVEENFAYYFTQQERYLKKFPGWPKIFGLGQQEGEAEEMKDPGPVSDEAMDRDVTINEQRSDVMNVVECSFSNHSTEKIESITEMYETPRNTVSDAESSTSTFDVQKYVPFKTSTPTLAADDNSAASDQTRIVATQRVSVGKKSNVKKVIAKKYDDIKMAPKLIGTKPVFENFFHEKTESSTNSINSGYNSDVDSEIMVDDLIGDKIDFQKCRVLV